MTTSAGARRSLGLSQAQLAIIMGIHPITVSKWERGVLQPTPYQRLLLEAFERAIGANGIGDVLKRSGPIEALYQLLQAARGA